MSTRLTRSITEPIRDGLTWHETWRGPDEGLIFCWERGRQERLQRPDDAARADKGELIGLDWKGGVRKKLKVAVARGTLRYLATWQGIRGKDLDINLKGETMLVCSRTQQAVVFTAAQITEAEQE
jgi:hypothetical protein